MDTNQVTLKDFFGSKKNESSLEQLHGHELIGEMKERLDKKEHKGVQWKAVWGSVIDHIDELLDISIVGIIVRPWKNFHELSKYKDPEKYPPDKTYLVPLLEHTITSTHQPEIVVELGPLFKKSIPFDITIELFLTGFSVEIQEGKIKKIYTGKCQGSGTVQCFSITLLSKESENITLPGVINLGEGISVGKG